MQEERPTAAKQEKKETSKRVRLLNNPDVKRWYDNLARANKRTADTRLRLLNMFCQEHQMTPAEITTVAQNNIAAMSDLLQDDVGMREEKGNSPTYIFQVVQSVQSWLRHDNIAVARKINIKGQGTTRISETERVPNASEMAEILNRADLRAGTAISLIAKAGLRLEVLGNYDGIDGLTMRDLPDIAIVQGTTICVRKPVKVIVRRTLSKTKQGYFTYLTENGTKKLLAYLNDRLSKGEALTADSPVIARARKYIDKRQSNFERRFLNTNQISALIRNTMKGRFNWRPYVFRSYFDTYLLTAKAQGKIIPELATFLMGHKGTIEAQYTTNKGHLPDELKRQMEEAFMRCEALLDQEIKEQDTLLKQKDDMHLVIEKATPEQLAKVQEVLNQVGICNT